MRSLNITLNLFHPLTKDFGSLKMVLEPTVQRDYVFMSLKSIGELIDNIILNLFLSIKETFLIVI